MIWRDVAKLMRSKSRAFDAAHRSLFSKYVALFVVVVLLALLCNGSFEAFFYYRDHKDFLVRLQREQAETAAVKIGQFVTEIENQIAWTTQLPWSADTIEQRRFDGVRLLRQVPAITMLRQIDDKGREQLQQSQSAMDVVASGIDFSDKPEFTEAVVHKLYYGPVYFHGGSEPYMTIAVGGVRRSDGVSIAEVNLKLIWDVVSQIKVGERGYAYVVDKEGRLIAHPDLSLVLRDVDLSVLPQVRRALFAAPGERGPEAANFEGQNVLTTFARVTPLGWFVFAEVPAEEATAPLYAALARLALVLIGALVVAVLAGVVSARRMVGPIQALGAGAARIGSGNLTQRIAIKTGDELEALADQFNEMAGRLQESYADLEHKVEIRTKELSAALRQVEEKGHALETALSRLEKELEAARKLQINMVPSAFPTPTVQCPIELFAMMEPAREVGGDLYDFFMTADGRLCVLIADASGKGMPAALFMARTKSLIRIAVEQIRAPNGSAADLPSVIARVNRELSENNDDSMFVSMFIAMLSPDTGRLEFCNAGHNPPYRLKEGRLAPIDTPNGIILGVDPDAIHRAGVLTLSTGETLFLYTDGVTEASNAAFELFGKERLESVLLRSDGRSSSDIIDAVATDVRDFVGAAEVSDDITMLALRRVHL